jgi:hypothetical protein
MIPVLRKTPKSKIHSSAEATFLIIDGLLYNCLKMQFTTAAFAAEWFFIAVLSTAMKKDIFLSVLGDSSHAKA